MDHFFIENLGNPVVGFILYAAVSLVLAIIATRQIFNLYTGVEVPAWLIFIWIIPVIGPIVTLVFHRKPQLDSAQKTLWREFHKEQAHRKHLSKEDQQTEFKKWSRGKAPADGQDAAPGDDKFPD